MIYYLLTLHWFADFVFQTDKMAKGKSTSVRWLILHVLEYFWVIFIGLSFLNPWSPSTMQFAFKFSFVNAGLHMVIDFFTSKLSSHFYKKGAIHNFFVVIGFDQLLHTACLILTFNYLMVPK